MSKYLLLLFPLLFSIYSVSYAHYSWKKRKRYAAVGVVILVCLSFALLLVYLLQSNDTTP